MVVSGKKERLLWARLGTQFTSLTSPTEGGSRCQLCEHSKCKRKRSFKLWLDSIWPEEPRIAKTMSYKLSAFLEASKQLYAQWIWQMRNQSSTLIFIGLVPITANESFWKSWIGVCELESIFSSKASSLEVQVLPRAGCQVRSGENPWAPTKGNQESKVAGLPWGAERIGSHMHLGDLVFGYAAH